MNEPSEITKYLHQFLYKEFPDVCAKTHITSVTPNQNKFIENICQILEEATQSFKIQPPVWETLNQTIKGNYFKLIPNEIKNHVNTHPLHGKIIRRSQFTVSSNNESSSSSSSPPKYTNVNVYFEYFIELDDPPMDKTKMQLFLDNCLYKIYLWLYVANKYKQEQCSPELNVYLYLTDLYKLYPHENGDEHKHICGLSQISPPIGEINANNGFSFSCVSPEHTQKNEINIYRKEEWFKVLIHETFHAFGMDYYSNSKLEKMANEQIMDIFNLSKNTNNVYGNGGFNIFECYTELMAELINVIIYSFVSSKTTKTKKENLYHKRKFLSIIGLEQTFSLFQCSKILFYHYNKKGRFPETPEELFGGLTDFKENTNLFSYYVLKSILICRLDEFLGWLLRDKDANYFDIRFRQTEQNIDEFCHLFSAFSHNSEITASTDTEKTNKYLFSVFEMFVWFRNIHNFKLHLCTIKTPIYGRFMSETAGQLCAAEMRKGVKTHNKGFMGKTHKNAKNKRSTVCWTNTLEYKTLRMTILEY